MTAVCSAQYGLMHLPSLKASVSPCAWNQSWMKSVSSVSYCGMPGGVTPAGGRMISGPARPSARFADEWSCQKYVPVRAEHDAV